MSVYYYSAFGDRLGSSIPLPELRAEEPGPVRWTFQVVDSLPPMTAAELLGEEVIYASVAARLYRHADGHRIVIDDTGSYELAADGIHISWLPNPEPWWDFGRSHLIGRVLATALQLAGTLTLHGSAVGMEDGVIGFLAPKHFGKSTLAMGLCREGAAFVTDDSLPVIPSVPILALPGIQSLRVHPSELDAADEAEGSAAFEPGRDGKVVLPPLPPAHVLRAPTALSALYFLRPVRPDGAEVAASRSRVPATVAAIRLVSQSKIGRMLGSGFAPHLLDATVAIASNVPTYELAVVRGLERLPEVVDQLVEWHGLSSAAVPTPG